MTGDFEKNRKSYLIILNLPGLQLFLRSHHLLFANNFFFAMPLDTGLGRAKMSEIA